MLLGSITTIALVFACGGPRKPGANANEVVFWKVETSDLEFGQCSDAPDFRSQITPIQIQPNSYFVYRVSKDAKHATTQDCQSFDPSTCADQAPPITFDIAGNELDFQREDKSPLTDGGCNLDVSQNWVGEDKGTSMSLDISNVMSLVDAPTDCDQAEADIKSQSPNGFGFQGCVVTYKLGFSHP